jgi:hypothetical protein
MNLAIQRAIRGEPSALVEHLEAHPEPESNVHSIELARTRRAIRWMYERRRD